MVPLCIILLEIYRAVPGESNFGKLMMLIGVQADAVATSAVTARSVPGVKFEIQVPSAAFTGATTTRPAAVSTMLTPTSVLIR